MAPKEPHLRTRRAVEEIEREMLAPQASQENQEKIDCIFRNMTSFADLAQVLLSEIENTPQGLTKYSTKNLEKMVAFQTEEKQMIGSLGIPVETLQKLANKELPGSYTLNNEPCRYTEESAQRFLRRLVVDHWNYFPQTRAWCENLYQENITRFQEAMPKAAENVRCVIGAENA